MIKHVVVPMYRANILMVNSIKDATTQLTNLCGNDKEQLKGHLDDLVDSDGLAVPINGTYFMFAERNVEAVVHESIHTANFILKDRGIIYSADNDEALAYPVGWIAQEYFNKAGWKKNG
jgi:hypothetical protein